MKRTSDTTKQTDKFGSGKHGYTEGTPGVTAPTRVRAADLDMLQEELANAVEDERALDSASYRQLADVLAGHRERAGLEVWKDHTGGTYTDVAFGAWGTDGLGLCGASGALAYVKYENGTLQTASAAGGYTGTFHCMTWSDGVSLGGGASGFIIGGASGELQLWTPGSAATHVALADAYADDVQGIADNGVDTVVIVGEAGMIQTIRGLVPEGPTTRATAGSLTGDDIFDVIWCSGLGLFVAAGDNGSGGPGIQTSPTGITWTARTASGTGVIRRLAYREGVGIIAVGDNGGGTTLVLKSTDGITWSTVSTPTLSTVSDVIALEQHFVVGSHNGRGFVLIPYRDLTLAYIIPQFATAVASRMTSCGTRVAGINGTADLSFSGRIA